MFWEPTESRYRRDNKMFHSSAFAIAAGVVGVGAAAGSAAISMSAADRAAKAQGRSGKEARKALKQATEQYNRSLDEYNRKQDEVRQAIAKINPNIEIPRYNLEGATQESINSANRITANTLDQLKNLIGRNPSDIVQQGLAQAEQWQGRLVNQYARIEGAYPQVERAGKIVSSLMEGDLTERQRRQLAQINAEMVGATYNPEAARRTAGFQIGQAQLLEATRQASEERQRFGLSILPQVTQQRIALASQAAQLGEAARGWQNTTQSWMELGRSFQQPVTQIMGIGLQGRQQDIGIAEANILNQMRQQAALGDINATELAAAQNRYNALTGQAQQNYNIAQQGIQSNLAAQQSIASGVQGIGSAAAGAIGGVGSAYSQLATAQGAGGTTYGSMAAAQKAAPYAGSVSQVYGMGYVPRATAV